MTTDKPTTLASLVEEVVEDWNDNDRPTPATEFVSAAAQEAVPVMTTELFKMVVDDNSLAFLDSSFEGREPFAVLATAIAGEVERLAMERIEAELTKES